MMDWSGYGARRGEPAQFQAQYHCQSTVLAGKSVNDGDKIYLPPSALDRLARMNIEYPMLFEVTSFETGKRTHCGVLEFSAEEGFCYMPYWMMENLAVSEGGLINLKNVSLSKATFVKFRARSVDFLEINNPRALLEVTLRKFTCLTVGDTIKISHLNKIFEFDVREVQPNGAASIIETDCNVDFDEPLGYKESKYAQYEKKAEPQPVPSAPRTLQKAREETAESADNGASFKPFVGAAKRIDGKLIPSAAQEKQSVNVVGNNNNGAKDSKGDAKSESPAASTYMYKSSIGDKYSKKKTAVAAFAGQAKKLNG